MLQPPSADGIILVGPDEHWEDRKMVEGGYSAALRLLNSIDVMKASMLKDDGWSFAGVYFDDKSRQTLQLYFKAFPKRLHEGEQLDLLGPGDNIA